MFRGEYRGSLVGRELVLGYLPISLCCLQDLPLGLAFHPLGALHTSLGPRGHRGRRPLRRCPGSGGAGAGDRCLQPADRGLVQDHVNQVWYES